MKQGFTFPGTLDSASRKKDRSIGIRLTSNLEMNTEEFSKIDALLGSEGWCLFYPNPIPEADIPEEPAQSREVKTFAQRWRAVNYLIWKQGAQDITFQVWYDRRNEKLLDKAKEAIN